jgi:CII-binding regulator of phage lambda lysogenization HflD
VRSSVEVAKQTIDEINLISIPSGLRFEIFDWKDDATPGFDEEPQARINKQAAGYDIFLCILGATIGSPTKKYASGTIEEVEGALAVREQMVFGSNSIMIFFKDVRLDPKIDDLASAQKVQEFRKTLGPKGVLYKDFADDVELKDAIRKTFGVVIASYLRSALTVEEPLSTEVGRPPAEEPEEEELGLFDYEAVAIENLTKTLELARGLNDTLQELGAKVEARGAEIQTANIVQDRALSKRLINDSAADMDATSATITSLVQDMEGAFGDAIAAAESYLDLQAADIDASQAEESRAELAESIQAIGPTIAEAETSVREFGDVISRMPRMTKELNIAKKNLLTTTEEVLRAFAAMRQMSQEAFSAMRTTD